MMSKNDDRITCLLTEVGVAGNSDSFDFYSLGTNTGMTPLVSLLILGFDYKISGVQINKTLDPLKHCFEANLFSKIQFAPTYLKTGSGTILFLILCRGCCIKLDLKALTL